jgi:TolA-binding protein
VSAAELGQVIGTALAPIVVALAPWLHARLRQLEQVRTPNAQRVGSLEDTVNYLRGRVDELAATVHALSVSHPGRARLMGEPPPPR